MEWPNANLLGWFTHHLKCYKATFLNYYFGGCYGFISYGLGMTAQKLHRTKYLSLGIFTGGENIQSLDKDFTRVKQIAITTSPLFI